MAARKVVQTSRGQRVVVAVLMAAVFAVALGLAHLTTGPETTARGVRGPRSKRVMVPGLALNVPAAWTQARDAVRPIGPTGAMAFRDPARSERVLWVAPVEVQASSPGAAVEWWLRQALSTRQLESARVRELKRMSTAAGRLTVHRYVGESEAAEGRGLALHQMAVLSDERGRRWLVDLTDQADPDGSLRRRRDRNLRLLLQVVGSATIKGR